MQIVYQISINKPVAYYTRNRVMKNLAKLLGLTKALLPNIGEEIQKQVERWAMVKQKLYVEIHMVLRSINNV